jgi:hypothetical protein
MATISALGERVQHATDLTAVNSTRPPFYREWKPARALEAGSGLK